MFMQQQFAHAHLPQNSIDDRARQDFVQSLKLHLARKVVPEIERIYETGEKAAFQRAHGRLPRDHAEVAAIMDGNYYYRLWGALYRSGQEMLWSSVAEPALRQAETLAERAKIAEPIGSLKLNPELEVPRYLTAVDIHCMPGGYHGERFEGDVLSGVLYDRGVHIYGMGGLGPKTDVMGRLVAKYLSDRFPQLQPKRILDLGCSVGHSTLPYAEMFPGAEIHAIDVGAPMLRYGHARAEAMGVPVHFRQMNAEALDYPDEHFDLVVSHILLHETSNKAIRRILKESRRVARTGGVVAHVDMCFYQDMSPFDGFMMMFDGPNNNEPFWTTFRQMNPAELLSEAGFTPDQQFFEQISRAYDGQVVFGDGTSDAGRGTWQLIGGLK